MDINYRLLHVLFELLSQACFVAFISYGKLYGSFFAIFELLSNKIQTF